MINRVNTTYRRMQTIAAWLIPLSVCCGLSSFAFAQSPLTRIPADEDANFPDGVVRLDFETDAAGNKLAQGADVSGLFVLNGCTFSTSAKGSYVGIQGYEIKGRSAGNSIATQKPLYQGIITIRFCEPGDETVPATVTTVGFWTAHVSPNGTSLKAYDKDDRLIGSISTAKNDVDFLAVKSTQPIASVQVVPDVEIDPDYAIDDLVFETPRPVKK